MPEESTPEKRIEMGIEQSPDQVKLVPDIDYENNVETGNVNESPIQNPDLVENDQSETQIVHSEEGEREADFSNYNEAGLQGPLINESNEQIKARLQEYLNGELPADKSDFANEVLDLSQTE